MIRVRPRTAARVAAFAFTAAAAAYLLAIRSGWVASRPAVLASVAAAAAVAFVVVLVLAVVRAVRGGARLAPAGEALTAAGVVVALGAGLHGWAGSLAGAFLVLERQPIRLDRPADVVAVQRGPLADPKMLELTVALARLELRPAGADSFYPVSHLKVLDRAGEEVGITVSREGPGVHGDLVFHQGAFGFAPRVYVTHPPDVVLDADIPLRTARAGPEGLQFSGEFEIEREGLSFRAAVDLGPLDPEMKGHPLLELAAERSGVSLGSGTLKPGEYVTLEGGYRVLFAGLKRWSEIDFVRRRRSRLPQGGLILAMVGGALWLAGATRRRP